ncbi:MAG TPA: D-alanyl-D-alanine carboxypeptidase family protein [Stellaceae bacterium]|jgi:D-alanyl-D-alanine carboxypeptidase (penicillin-binding protein 5/6)|nr:D-alanyl-D-alanine carboxypeptidase family protein [Stellaceae bacterium]
MKLHWSSSIAGGLVLAAVVLFAASGSSPVLAAKMTKPAAPGKPSAADQRGKGVAPAPAETATTIDTEAKHAFVIEVETGAVLLDKGADERVAPASMSKVMTAYVVFGLLKQGRAKLDDELPVSEHAWRTGGSKMFVPVGGRLKIDDLLRGMLVQSGNDACIVLAEGLAGSEDAFVDLMNAKAKEIGLTNSHFADVDGLPNPDHWMTARDLATLAIRTQQDFPEYYHYYSEKDYNFNNINQGNRNPLLYKDLGADGMKTGHTDESGYSLLGSVHRGNRRVILVLAGMPTMKSRASEGERVTEWAFREFNDYQLFSAGDKVDDADVWLGTEPKVPLAVNKDLLVTMPRKSRKDMKVTVSYNKPIPAPVHKDMEVGKVVVTAPDLSTVEMPLVTAGNVDRMGAFGRMAMVAANLIWGNRH